MRFPLSPTYSNIPELLKGYFLDWYNALFTQIEDYSAEQLAVENVIGGAAAQISRMGRTAAVLVRFAGSSASGSFSLAVRPLGNQVLHVSRMTSPPTVLGLAGVDENGLVSLPNFSDGAEVLVSGIILERD